MMLYLLDANVLIEAEKTYYAHDLVPMFWKWLLHHGEKQNIKVPQEIVEEISKSKKDWLYAWLYTKRHLDKLTLQEEVDMTLLQRVISDGYGIGSMSDVETKTLGRDPFLIAYGVSDIENRCIVSLEKSKEKAKRANKKVPDVCQYMNVQHCNTFDLIRNLGFSTSWSE